MLKYSYEEFTGQIRNLNIDLFISSSSFEDRCFVIPTLLTTIPLKTAAFFYNNNEYLEVIENSEKLTQILSNSNRHSLNSDHPVATHFKLLLFFKNALDKIKKPNILFDTSTFTHETLLSILKILHMRRNELGNVYITYVGAKEYSWNSKTTDEKWLSKGIKEIRTIIGYSGFTDPTQKNHLVILFGFESERTQKIIEQYEYEFISLGFANIDSSIQVDHQKINYERHSKLLLEYPNARKFTFSLVDPLQTKKDILEYLKTPELKDLNTVIAPLNNKLSTIGAGLAAIENENIQLAYAKPNLYNVSGYSKPNDDIYLYQLPFNIETE